MSRSFKKNGVLKYGSTIHKNKYNKVLRRINKVRIQCDKEPFLMYEVINPWDINDERYVHSFNRSPNKQNRRFYKK